MLKKTITYTDYNDNPRTEDFYFNLTKVELMRMEATIQGGLSKKLERVSKAKDAAAIMEVMEDLIRKSYGIKTADGGFVKRQEYVDEFVSTDAYSELFMELVTDADKASEFVKGILPANLSKSVNVPAKAE